MADETLKRMLLQTGKAQEIMVKMDDAGKRAANKK
jgi:hypothetical protein